MVEDYCDQTNGFVVIDLEPECRELIIWLSKKLQVEPNRLLHRIIKGFLIEENAES